MADKPSVLPRWASDAEADIVEPSEAQKDTGWESGDTPAASVFNWWWEKVYRWLAYFKERDEAPQTLSTPTHVGTSWEAFSGTVYYEVTSLTSDSQLIFLYGCDGTEKIERVRAQVRDDAAEEIFLACHHYEFGDTSVSTAASDTSDESGTVQTLEAVFDPPLEPSAGDILRVRINFASGTPSETGHRAWPPVVEFV